jgi:transketolase
MAESHLAATYNTPDFPDVFQNFTYVICGDGCLQEGISSEASSLAGHLGLGKLIVLYDDNSITIDGPTDLSFTEDVQKRYEAYGWHVQQVTDVVTQLDDLRTAINAARTCTDKPSLIAVKTLIGQGSPSKQGHHSAHGAPLGKDDLSAAKKAWGFPTDEMFHVSAEVQAVFDRAVTKNEAALTNWQSMFDQFTAKYPDQAQEIQRRFAAGGVGALPQGLVDKLPTFTIGQDKDQATRKFSEGCINAIAPNFPEFMGGSADLTPSNNTRPKNAVDYQKDTPHGRYIRFGIREHAMAAICNGLFAYGGMRPYCATFLTFYGYCAGAVRLSALSKFGILYVFTHDSIGLGEDGPTHQPIETLECMRCTPNLNVWRPADSNEMSAAYKSYLEHATTPTVICCSRSTVKGLFGSSIEKASKGGYTALDCDGDDAALILVSTGSEVEFCVSAAETLTQQGIPTRVVSMPCMEVFLAQSEDYQASVLPGNIPTLSVEASSPHGWHAFSHAQISMGRFGASGPGAKNFDFFGYSPSNIATKGKALVDFYKTNGTSVPALRNVPKFGFEGMNNNDGH